MANRFLAVVSYDSLLSGSAIFHPKNPISINSNPKFDRELNLWLFYNLNLNYTWFLRTFYTLNNQILHVLQSILISNPNSQTHQQQQNYMLNSVSELHNLRLENVSPTLTLD